MKIKDKFNEIVEKAGGRGKIRILAFGSSNTERFIPGTHWFDCLDLAIQARHGRIHTCINNGVGGETAGDLLRRFDGDAAFYRPQMAFITIGGNDANPEKNISRDTYRQNLLDLYAGFKKIGTFVIFQTYYAPIRGQISIEHYSKFLEFMQTVRDVAEETDSGLIDHLSLWIPFCTKNPARHGELMNDAFHVNHTGNLVLGLNVARQFGLPLNGPFFEEAKKYLEDMDGSA